MESPFAKLIPVNNVPASPGPWVTAIASISERLIFALAIAESAIRFKNISCSLEAISGTTPPYFECIDCELTSFDKIYPSLHTATAVSSQDVSIPITIILLFLRHLIQDFLEKDHAN